MRASSQTYEKVARNCSEFNPDDRRAGFSNSVADDVSCMKCKHFDDEEYCKLDLYDPIVENEENFNSSL